MKLSAIYVPTMNNAQLDDFIRRNRIESVEQLEAARNATFNNLAVAIFQNIKLKTYQWGPPIKSVAGQGALVKQPVKNVIITNKQSLKQKGQLRPSVLLQSLQLPKSGNPLPVFQPNRK